MSLPSPLLVVDGEFGHRRLYMHNELRLTGWALAHDGVRQVFAQVDGARYLARFGLPSPELLGGHPEIGSAGQSRFELAIDARGFPSGLLGIELCAETEQGRLARLAGEIVFLSFEPPGFSETENRERLLGGRPVMWVEQPNLDGHSQAGLPVAVEGWVHAASGITSVDVFIDGTRGVRAAHGFPRPSARGLLGDDAGGAGFAVSLATVECDAGHHELIVVATAADGQTVGFGGTLECLSASPPERREHLTDERYVPEAHAGHTLEPEHQARYRWVAPLAKERRVLDAACGTGFGSEILAAEGPAELQAFDLNELAIDDATRRLGDRAVVVAGDLNAIPFADDAFDLVVCFEAIEHIADPDRGLDQLARVLDPGGILAISTPNRGVYARGNPHHLHEFASDEFEAALKRRFAHVSVWRQDIYGTSLISDDGTYELSDPNRRLELDLRKVRGGRVGSELYMVALASRAPLPRLTGFGVLGQALDQAALIEERELWRQRADRLSALLTDTRLDAEQARRDAEESPQGRALAERAWRAADQEQARLADVTAAVRDELGARITWTESFHDQAVAERDQALRDLARLRDCRAVRLSDWARRALRRLGG